LEHGRAQFAFLQSRLERARSPGWDCRIPRGETNQEIALRLDALPLMQRPQLPLKGYLLDLRERIAG
jgi:hypothetical protein